MSHCFAAWGVAASQYGGLAEAETPIDPNSREAWWDMAPDSSLSFIGRDDNNLKRITITPSPGINIVTLLGGGGAGNQGN